MEIPLAGAHQKYPTIAIHPSGAIKVALAGVTHLQKNSLDWDTKSSQAFPVQTHDGPVQL